MKTLKRLPLYSFETLAATLLIQTKSLEIKFRKKLVNKQTLVDLKEILSWCKIHTEVNSLVLTSFCDEFIQGIDPILVEQFSPVEMSSFLKEFSEIINLLLELPQTLILDLKNGARGIGLELSLACDIRICNPEAIFQFNQLENGLIPASGSFSILKDSIQKNLFKSLVLLGNEFNKEAFSILGGHTENNFSLEEILIKLSLQSNVSRIQAKLSFQHKNEFDKNKLNEDRNFERQVLFGTLQSCDYKKNATFVSIKQMREQLSEL